MSEFITIDGSQGEGGGQVLRTSLSLSLITGKTFRLENIRAKRQKPGLLRQHLTAVMAAAEIGTAKTEGAFLGSKTLTFHPGEVRSGKYQFAVGTAGSATLVFQTILPALMLAEAPSELVLEGGTHNMQAPPFDFLEQSFLPLLNRMGPQVHVHLERYGFHPAGGGRFVATIQPCKKLSPLEVIDRGEILDSHAIAIVANLAGGIAKREIEVVATSMNWQTEKLNILQTRESAGPGNVLFMKFKSANLTTVFTGFGQVGRTSENVAMETVREARSYLASGAAVCPHLSDQILLPLALAGDGAFSAQKLTQHAQTNMEVISRFLSVQFATELRQSHSIVRVNSTAGEG